MDDVHVDPNRTYVAADLDRYWEREWLDETFDQFLKEHDSGYFLLEAGAGVGKTTYAAWLSRSRGYPADFAHGAGHRTASSVRKSLAVQLIRRWNLTELAPGGTLPSASVRADWFEQVITSAARRRDSRKPDEKIVIVIDGLDMVRRTDLDDTVGLPHRLPPGVYVMATCRTGSEGTAYQYWAPYAQVTIHANDDRNLSDMRRFLEREVRDPAIAAAMARSVLSPAAAVRLLLRKCDGVWIYLRHVLDEIREGRREADDLESLPNSLWAYYAENLQQLRNAEEEWGRQTLPVLGVLAAAQEPLTIELINRFAMEPGTSFVRRFLQERFRSFCIQDNGAEPRFQLYHSSLREFLTGGSPAQERAGSGVISSELAVVARATHNRVADRYLAAWGRLDQGLALLCASPDPGMLDDGYGLRHVVSHLEVTRRYGDIHRLLACTRVGMSADGTWRSQHLWYAIRSYAQDQQGYLEDVERARAIAVHQARTDRKEGRERLLAAVIRYSLTLATFNSIAGSIRVQFAAALLRAGVWSPKAAMAYAARVPRLVDRARAYLWLSRELAEPDRGVALTRALEAIAGAPSGTDVSAILIALAPDLPADLIEEMAAPLAMQQGRTGHRVASLSCLLRALPAGRRARLTSRLLEQASFTLDVDEAVDVLIASGPYLDVEQAERAGQLVREWGDPTAHAAMAVALSWFLGPQERDRIAQTAVILARTVSNPDQAIELLLRIVDRMPHGSLSAVAGGAARLEDAPDWGLVAQGLASALPDPQVGNVLNALFLSPGSRHWLSTLEAIAHRLDDETVRHLLSGIAGLSKHEKAQVVLTVSPRVPISELDVFAVAGVPQQKVRALRAAHRPEPEVRLSRTREDLRLALSVASRVNDHLLAEGLTRRLENKLRELTPSFDYPTGATEEVASAGWIVQISEVMAASARPAALTELEAHAHTIARAGRPVVHAVVGAVNDVCDWWP